MSRLFCDNTKLKSKWECHKFVRHFEWMKYNPFSIGSFHIFESKYRANLSLMNHEVSLIFFNISLIMFWMRDKIPMFGSIGSFPNQSNWPISFLLFVLFSLLLICSSLDNDMLNVQYFRAQINGFTAWIDTIILKNQEHDYYTWIALTSSFAKHVLIVSFRRMQYNR